MGVKGKCIIRPAQMHLGKAGYIYSKTTKDYNINLSNKINFLKLYMSDSYVSKFCPNQRQQSNAQKDYYVTQGAKKLIHRKVFSIQTT